MSVNAFNDADFRNIPAATLQTLATNTLNAINNRLTASNNLPEAVESYQINGRTEQRTPLEFLIAMLNAIYRAIQMQGVEPDGIGIALARFGNAAGRRGPKASGF